MKNKKEKNNAKGVEKKSAVYVPFVVLFLVELWIHKGIVPNFGDDLWFKEVACSEGFSFLAWLHQRYMEWSSRTAIELLLMITVRAPLYFWRIVDSALITCVAIFLSKMAIQKTEDSIYINTITSMLVVTITYTILNSAGWIATTVNYMWPLSFGIMGLYPLRKLLDYEKINGFEMIFYSACLLIGANAEQMSVVILTAYVIFDLYCWFSTKKIYKYAAIQTGLSVLSLIYIILSPGNAIRKEKEIEAWFPVFADMSLFNKVDLGISAVIKEIFLQDNVFFFMMLFTLMVLIWQKYEKWQYRVLGAIPAFFLLSLSKMHGYRGDERLPFSLVQEMGIFVGDRVYNYKTYIVVGSIIGVCCLILILFYLFGKNTWTTWILIGTFVMGLATKAVMGFSPTVWASGYRTGWIMNFAFLFCTLFMLREWNFKNKNATCLLMGITAVCVFIIFLLYRTKYLERISLISMKIFLFISVLVLSLGWIFLTRPVPVADDMMVSNAAVQFLNNDYSMLQKGGYVYQYVHQLGIIWLLEQIYRLFGAGNYLVYQMLNVLALCIVYGCLLKLSKKFFKTETAERITVVMLFMFCVPIFYTTFVYGNLLGLALSLLGFVFLLEYFENRKLRYAVAFVVCAVLAVLVKSNYQVAMIAMAAVLFVDCMKSKKGWNLLCIVLMFSLSFGAQAGLEKYYSARSGIALEKGASKLLWIAMGMQKGPLAEGWYDVSLIDMMNEASETGKTEGEVALNHIQESLKGFSENKKGAVEFYYHKIVSQWNEPSFEALWVSNHQPDQHPDGISKIAASFYYGRTGKILYRWFDVIHFLILSMAGIGIWKRRKQMELGELLLLTTVLGGFFFHILWEAKSQYIWTYFILLIPTASGGIREVGIWLDARGRKHS